MVIAKPYVPREFRVTLRGSVTHAAIIPLDAPLAPLPKPATVSEPIPAPPEPTPPAPDLWVTEIGAQLAADRKTIEQTLEAVRQAVADLQHEHTERLREWQKAAVELALTIATKLLYERVTADQFPVEAMIRDMAAQMHEDEIVTIRLNPADLAVLEKRLDGEPLLPGLGDPQLIPDPNLARGECRADGRSSVSLSELPRQLTQIRDELLGRLAHARS
jgi:flagellar biosynthesis/type III secretory pathway protein FliH